MHRHTTTRHMCVYKLAYGAVITSAAAAAIFRVQTDDDDDVHKNIQTLSII